MITPAFVEAHLADYRRERGYDLPRHDELVAAVAGELANGGLTRPTMKEIWRWKGTLRA